MADHSVFINVMLWQTDNQNLDFASNCVEWLTEKGRRKEVYFFDEGIPQQTFDLPLKEMPAPSLPPPESLVAAFDQVLAGLERENRFNELILNLTNSTMSRDRAQLAIIRLSLVMGVFALQRLSAPSIAAAVSYLATAVADLELGRPHHEQRSRALTDRGNYWAAHGCIDIFEPLLAAAAGRSLARRAGRLALESFLAPRYRAFGALAVIRPRHWARVSGFTYRVDQRLRSNLALGSFRLSDSPVPGLASQTALPKLHSAR